MNGYGYLYIEKMTKGGSYTIQVSNLNWGQDSVKDFTVAVYSAAAVTITDEDGNEGVKFKTRKLSNRDDPQDKEDDPESGEEDEDEDDPESDEEDEDEEDPEKEDADDKRKKQRKRNLKPKPD